MEPYEIPTHLERRSTFIWGLTARQVCVIAMGVTFAYMFAGNITNWLDFCLFIIIMLVALAFAFIRVQHLDLEKWLLVWVAYMGMPKVFLWAPLQIEEREEITPNAEQEERGELW